MSQYTSEKTSLELKSKIIITLSNRQRMSGGGETPQETQNETNCASVLTCVTCTCTDPCPTETAIC